MTRDDCCVGKQGVMILACSGASNVGQLTNQAAVELTLEGFGKMFCLAGIGGGLSAFVQSARDVPDLVVLDGCATACARAVLEKAQVPSRKHLVLTGEGIEKNKDLTLRRSDIDRVKALVKRLTCGNGAGERSKPGCCCRGDE